VSGSVQRSKRRPESESHQSALNATAAVTMTAGRAPISRDGANATTPAHSKQDNG
jgi:hypothetical protein